MVGRDMERGDRIGCFTYNGDAREDRKLTETFPDWDGKVVKLLTDLGGNDSSINLLVTRETLSGLKKRPEEELISGVLTLAPDHMDTYWVNVNSGESFHASKGDLASDIKSKLLLEHCKKAGVADGEIIKVYARVQRAPTESKSASRALPGAVQGWVSEVKFLEGAQKDLRRLLDGLGGKLDRHQTNTEKEFTSLRQRDESIRADLESRLEAMSRTTSNADKSPPAGVEQVGSAELDKLSASLEKHQSDFTKSLDEIRTQQAALKSSMDELKSQLDELKSQPEASPPELAVSEPAASEPSDLSGGEMVQVLAQELESEVAGALSALRERIHGSFATVGERLAALDKVAPLKKGKRADEIEAVVDEELSQRLGVAQGAYKSAAQSASAQVAGFVRTLVRIPDLESDQEGYFVAPVTTRIRSMVSALLRDEPKPAVVEACRAVVEACGLELLYPKLGSPHDPARYRMDSLERGTAYKADQVCRVVEAGYMDGKKVLQQAVVVVSQ